MPEVEVDDEIIMGFVRWARLNGIDGDFYTDAEMEQFIATYMRSRMAGG